MIQQTVTITPPFPVTPSEAMGYVRNLLPANVLSFLNDAEIAGTRTTSVSINGNIITVTNEWDEAAAQEYKTLMADVSDNVIAEMNTNGWTIEFTPLTKDL